MDLIKGDILNFINSAYDKGVIVYSTEKLITPPNNSLCENLFFSITNYCNKNCEYCYEEITSDMNTSSFMTLEEIKNVMEKLYPSGECKNTRIYLTGGEPLAHENLLSIINYLRTYNAQVGIFSNGSLLTDELARKLSNYNIFIFLSLDSANEEINDRIRGKNSFAEVIHASSILHANNIPFFFAVTLSDFNIHELNQLIPLAQQCHSLGLYLNEPVKMSKMGKVFNDFFSYSYQKYNETIYDCAKKISIINSWRNRKVNASLVLRMVRENNLCLNNIQSLQNKKNCGAGKNNLAIDWLGNVYPCRALQQRNFRMGNITDLSSNTQINELLLEYEDCHNCDIHMFCLGGCKAEIVHFSGQLDEPYSQYCAERKSIIKKTLWAPILLSIEDVE